jgi:hypothetical protein
MEISMSYLQNSRSALLSLACIGGLTAFAQSASAATQVVNYQHLVSSATVATALGVGDTLFADTFTTETGALQQETTFTVGPNVGSFIGRAAWEVGTAPEPRLVGVNIDILDAGNHLVVSDTFAGVLAGFAHSTFGPDALIQPGTYKLVATGNGVSDSSLDISLTFAQAMPEARTVTMLLAGLGVLGLLYRRRMMF